MDHHVSHLSRLLSQAGSLCVSSAFGNGGDVLAVGPALHTFPLEVGGEVQNIPASFSSSELSAHQMAPCGVVPHSSSTHEEFFVSSILLDKDGEHCTECREALFRQCQSSSVGNR